MYSQNKFFKDKIGFAISWEHWNNCMCSLNDLYAHWKYFYENSMFSEGYSNDLKKTRYTALSNQNSTFFPSKTDVKYSIFWIHHRNSGKKRKKKFNKKSDFIKIYKRLFY